MLAKGGGSMRKTTVIVVFIICLFLCSNEVKAYSPHYLPGGDNYLSEDNFHLEGEYFLSIESFLVKPFTEYILSISRSYYENENVEVIIELYNNLELNDTINLSFDDFSSLSDYNAFYHVFSTDSDTNYMAIKFHTDRGYFSSGSPKLQDFMLEEGSSYDGYEEYLEGSLIDITAPYFQNAGTVISYVDTPISINEIKSALNAYDAIDGDVSAAITLVSDNYTPNASTLGEYDATFAVSDSSGNETEIVIQIVVVDAVKPVFSPQETIKAVYPSAYSPEAIRMMLSASDNYDGDISMDIELVSDEYTPNKNQIGVYEMVFGVEDSSGNWTETTINVEVVDETAPIITGTDSISVGYDYLIVPTIVKQGLSVIDDYDGDLSDSLSLVFDDYTENSGTLGNHQMRFSVTDSSGNESTKTVTITVIDEIGPLVYFDMAVIQVYNDMVLSLGDVAVLLKATGELSTVEKYRFYVNYDSYTGHASIPGIYHLLLNIEPESQPAYEKNFEIRVINRTAKLIIDNPKPGIVDDSFWAKLKKAAPICSLSVLLVLSNAIWLILTKKKRLIR